MRTQAFILSAPSSATRKPPAKRRKLANHTLLTSLGAGSPTKALMETGPDPDVVATMAGHGTSVISGSNTKMSCSTCHRSLSSAMRPTTNVPTVCSRCSALTCAICSRICSSYTRHLSFPPTPALTRSSSPSPHAHTPDSYSSSFSLKRAALGLSLSTMNRDVSAIASVKRKKAPVDKEEAMIEWESGDQPIDTCYERADGYSTSVLIFGCRRVICRACSIESVANDGTLCMDCYALL
ncbi:hypothetical protein F5I97DRAFT_1043337 [Phlebopus sp. FC_14]|nr:hypothetical protein F5I97DRAFT_1043337 [Phlebopus sp. FC_14]